MPFEIRFPDSNEAADQDEEFCEVVLDGEIRKIRFHDYDEIFEVPGLYEQLFYDELRCTSPDVVIDLLAESVPLEGLRVLDLGAGNGMVGERLAKLGVGELVGVDIIPEAATATHRDRPGVYDDYVVGDMTDLPQDDHRRLEERQFTCLTSVAALGFGDVPPEVFQAAFDRVQDGGWVAFTIKEDFLDRGEDDSGFSGMIAGMLRSGTIDERGRRRYRHRLDVTGDPIHYVAIAGVKRSR